MAKNRGTKGNPVGNAQNMSPIVKKINELRFAIDQYKAENPDIDVEAILSEQKELLPILDLVSNRELNKFITYAKEQGTKMSFHDMEMGVVSAGRKDMQSGLAEILDSITFDKPVCSECLEEKENRGRTKKKL
jgi:hypothetical protein